MAEIVIPPITTEYFDEVYIQHIMELYRYDVKEELEYKLSGDTDSNLNKRAERYIDTYLMNEGTTLLNENNWKACKELYIEWKLFEEVEVEDVSKDKKESLHELLDLFKERVTKTSVNTASNIYGLEVF